MDRIKITLKKVDVETSGIRVRFIDTKSGRIIDRPDKAYIRDVCYDKFVDIHKYFLSKYNFELTYTDMYRTQAEQIAIYRDRQKHPEKGKAGRPCLSPHLYGMAFDVNVKGFKGFGIREFETIAGLNGFNGIESEDWHYQYFHLSKNRNNFYDEILEMCKPYLPMTMEEIFERLNFLGYSSDTSGIIKFQGDVGLIQDGIAGQQTQIRLILMTCEYEFI